MTWPLVTTVLAQSSRSRCGYEPDRPIGSNGSIDAYPASLNSRCLTAEFCQRTTTRGPHTAN